MYQCTKCKHTVEYTTNYCPLCGAETVQVEYVVVSARPQPVAEPQPICQPTYQQSQPAPTPVAEPNYYYAPPQPEPAKKPHLAKKIVAMVLSIEAFALSAIYFWMVFLYKFIDYEYGMVLAIVCGIICLPMSIVGLAMSNSCRNAGDNSGMTRVGRIFGILGIVIAALYLIIGCVGDIGYIFSDFYGFYY